MGLRRFTQKAIASIAMSMKPTFAPVAFSMRAISSARSGRLVGARSAAPSASAATAEVEPDETTSTSIASCASRNSGRIALRRSPTDELPTQRTVPARPSTGVKTG